MYATGWIKRGPVGLIGHTKGDALETIGFLLQDRLNLPPAEDPSESAIIALLESRGVQYTTWEGWLKLDAHELKLGANFVNTTGTAELVRERVKLVPRDSMVAVSRGE